jgi:hypothetical protein
MNTTGMAFLLLLSRYIQWEGENLLPKRMQGKFAVGLLSRLGH